ncbi:MAG: dicarboxylate/amino acid:cation symporter [Acidobacteria bacterium]|nr:MAG: dicarboxylate/amino acid:cation symporter [Acidobacteriota bacterium]
MEQRANLPWYRRLHWQIFVAMGLGIVAGLIGGEALVPKVAWIGTLFLKLLKMIIVPLVLTSIVSGVASVGSGRDLGRLFGKTMGYYVMTSALAALTGLLLVNLIKPGVGANLGGVEQAEMPELASKTPIDLVLDLVPENVVRAAADGDMLPIIVFCILLGATIAALPKAPQRTLIDFFSAAFQAIMLLTRGIMRFLPIGVFAMITKVVGSSGVEAFQALGLYMLTIALGLLVHLFVTLPLVLRFLGGIPPAIHFRNMVEPLAMAFSTSSSAATLPVTINAVENKVGVSNKVSSFVLPMGATVNMDGTALYECAGVIFISQVLGAQLGFTEQLIVVATALLASIGAAAVPSAGLVIIFIVLEAVNLRGPEVDAIVLTMLAIDRPLDMARTAVNVFSDSCGAAIIARSEGETEVDARVVA